MRQADLAEELLRREGQGLPLGADLLGQFVDVVVEAGDLHPALVVVQRGEDLRQHPDRVGGSRAVHARMQVAVGGLDGDLLADQPAQHGGDAGLAGREHAGVADQGDVLGQLLRVLLQEGHEGGRARFLLPLEQDRDLRGQLAVNLDPGAAGLDEGHQLALVVGGAAGADHAAAVGERVDLRIEGLRVPQVQRVDRLHVVVAVEKEAGPVRPLLGQRVAMGHDHGVAGGGTHLRVEAERGQLPRQPLRRGGAVGLVGGIGRDGGEAQQVEQPLEPRVEILVEAVQDGGKGGMGHRRLREGERIAAEPALGRRIRQPAPGEEGRSGLSREQRARLSPAAVRRRRCLSSGGARVKDEPPSAVAARSLTRAPPELFTASATDGSGEQALAPPWRAGGRGRVSRGRRAGGRGRCPGRRRRAGGRAGAGRRPPRAPGPRLRAPRPTASPSRRRGPRRGRPA